MRRIKFLHCADIHMDMPFTSLGTGNGKSSVRREDLKKTFDRIIDTAREECVDLLLIAGDLYEHEYVRKSTINFINDRFSRIPDIKVILVPGNHDPYVANSYYRNYRWSLNVHILTADVPYIIFDDIGVCVYGAGFSNFYGERPLVNCSKRAAETHLINILLAHGTLSLAFSGRQYNPLAVDDLDSLGMDYIALGHFHNRIEGLGKNRNIYNPGSPEPLGFDETGEHGVFAGSIVKWDNTAEISGLRFIKLNSRSYENLEVDVSGCNIDEQVIERIKDAICGSDMSNGLFSVKLKGYVESGFKVNTSLIQSCLKDSVFFLKITDETMAEYNFDEIVKEPGLRGLFVRKALALMDGTWDEREKSLLMKALYYGLEALERGEVEI